MSTKEELLAECADLHMRLAVWQAKWEGLRRGLACLGDGPVVLMDEVDRETDRMIAAMQADMQRRFVEGDGTGPAPVGLINWEPDK